MSQQKRRNKGPAKVTVVENQKGGVGKTTFCYHIPCYLVEQGYRVLAVDLDPQGNLSSRFLSRALRTNGYRSVHMFGNQPIAYEPLSTPIGVDLIYALDRDVELANVERMPLGEAVINFCQNLGGLLEEYDYIVIDTPPAHGNKMTAASVSSNFMFVPVELAAFAVTGVESVLETLAEMQNLVDDPIKITGVICNRMRKVKAHAEALAELQAAAGNLKILTTKVATNGAIDDALRDGVPVWKNRATGAQRESGKMMITLMEEIASLIGAKPLKAPARVTAKPKGVSTHA
ncbi:ParA family protein [Pseudomonas sp. P66]|uniref:ParA family protein n=1 Tax=Pseudomonas arcuscaelestis TaxID=2710591 RepID=A0ABS2BZ84_9PSED|nr:ParA family protein [Pseudomonas arcuscaelestis]MBM5458938.1 ParA family protein [Pseudomonas arcuscaelestis]